MNAADLVKPPSFEKWTPPVADDPQYSDPVTVKDSPDYHEDPVYEISPSTRLMEGNRQCQTCPSFQNRGSVLL